MFFQSSIFFSVFQFLIGFQQSKFWKNNYFCTKFLIVNLKFIFSFFVIDSIQLLTFKLKENDHILFLKIIFYKYLLFEIWHIFFWFLYFSRNKKEIQPSIDRILMCEFTIKNNQLFIPKENKILLIYLSDIL
jgi:hypothetical protein